VLKANVWGWRSRGKYRLVEMVRSEIGAGREELGDLVVRVVGEGENE